MKEIKNYSITPMLIEDYAEIYKLWDKTEGIILSRSDSEESLKFYLNRNPEMSFIARNESENIIGTILCGHDGSKGYIRHLVVNNSYRKLGIGKNLVEKSLSKLKLVGITKCSVFLLTSNKDGGIFWKRNGWYKRDELKIMSISI